MLDRLPQKFYQLLNTVTHLFITCKTISSICYLTSVKQLQMIPTRMINLAEIENETIETISMRDLSSQPVLEVFTDHQQLA